MPERCVPTSVAPYLKALRRSTAGPDHSSPLLFLAVAADPYLKALRRSTAGPDHSSPLLFLAVAADPPVIRLSASTRFVGAISSPSWAGSSLYAARVDSEVH